jgi:hypothetical protein
MAFDEAAAMTWFQLYAFFGGPLIVLIIGLGVAYAASRDGIDERSHRVPGE